MTSNMEWNIQLPTEPTANIVLIKNISGQTQEATIKDFFSFCGQIQAFEMRKTNENELQEAIVYFEQASAAKTATLLSQGKNKKINKRYLIINIHKKKKLWLMTVQSLLNHILK